MEKKPFFIKPTDSKNKRKALEHLDKEENKITGEVILGGWRENISAAKAGDIEDTDTKH